jgi:xanthine dehydrogenase YagS FAD-binding subunit
MRASEALLVGQRPATALWARAADRAVEGARPLSGNAYKVRLLRRTIIRALELTGDIA